MWFATLRLKLKIFFNAVLMDNDFVKVVYKGLKDRFVCSDAATSDGINFMCHFLGKG